MIKLPQFMEKDKNFTLLKMDDFSCVMHRQAIGQEKIQIVLTKSLLVFIIEGRKVIHTEEGDINIDAGEAFFAEKGAYLLSDKLNSVKGFQSLLFFIDDTFFKEFTGKNKDVVLQINCREIKYKKIYKIVSPPLLKDCAESLLSYFTIEFPNKKELLKIKFEELFFHLINSDPQQHFARFLKQMLLSAKIDINSFMNENFTYPLTVEEFAKQTSRSLSSFKIEFKKIFNTPPGKWINKKRLERAKVLLAATDKNVTEVCFEAGFDNVSHFIQLFKKEFGITPKKAQRVN